MNKYYSILIGKLKPYISGIQIKNKIVKLNTNENPYRPYKKNIFLMKKEVENNLNLYPDPNSNEFKKILSKKFNLSKKEIFIGNGSDEIIAHIFQAFFKYKKPILFPNITYGFYESYSKLYEINFFKIPLNKEYLIDYKKYLNYKNKIGGIIIPNPNAPTGCFLKIYGIKKILKFYKNIIVLIDEAYIDFGGISCVKLIKKYKNLLITRTLSKSLSLAGLRVGYVLGNKDLILALENVKNSFNSYPIDKIAIKGATIAMINLNYYRKIKLSIIRNRELLIKDLKLLGFKILPSKSNFIFISHIHYNAYNIFLYLYKNKILVRYFNKFKINKFLRITIGNKLECNYLLYFLKKFIIND